MLPDIIKSAFDYKNRPTHEEFAAANHKIARLEEENRSYRELEYIQQGKEKLEQQLQSLKNQINELTCTKSELKHQINDQRVYISEFEMEEFLDNFGFTELDYNLETFEEYEIKLREIKQRQREMQKNKAALILTDNTTKNEQNLNPQMLDVFRQILLSNFNIACRQIILDTTLSKSNYPAQRRKIHNVIEYTRSLEIPLHCLIPTEYSNLMLAELYTFHKAQVKHFENEIERREISKKNQHEKRVESEIQQDYKAALAQGKALESEIKLVEKQAKQNSNPPELLAKIKELKKELQAVTDERKLLKVRTQFLTTGHVYIASNIGSFGKDVCIIGMTQELKPLEYIQDLGKESVPFAFDLHALVLSENAVELKNKLHEKFSEKRLNQCNQHTDFFKVSLDEVNLALKEIIPQDKTAKAKMKFVPIPKATEYRNTLAKICNNLS